jgi:MtN3 and saliva related transmembrane protein
LGKEGAETPRKKDGMTTETWVAVVGTVGGICTTFAYVPQVVKIWKQGGRDLSYGMLGLYLIGVLLWLTYGLLLHAEAVILANAATAILIAFATGLKAWTAKRDEIKNSLSSTIAPSSTQSSAQVSS